MLAQSDVDRAEPLEEPVGEHRPRPSPDLLGRLHHRQDRARPARAVRGEALQRPDQRRHVRVVPACVHHGHRRAVRVDAGVPAAVGDRVVLGDREAVHVRAQEDGGPGSVA